MDISVKVLQLPDFVELVREPLGEGNFNSIFITNYIFNLSNLNQ